MALNNYTPPSNVAERNFMDFMQHGDDFFKIELLRPAKIWYNKALELNLDTGKVKQRIAECDRLLAFERKVVRILGSIAIALLLVYYLFLR